MGLVMEIDRSFFVRIHFVRYNVHFVFVFFVIFF